MFTNTVGMTTVSYIRDPTCTLKIKKYHVNAIVTKGIRAFYVKNNYRKFNLCNKKYFLSSCTSSQLFTASHSFHKYCINHRNPALLAAELRFHSNGGLRLYFTVVVYGWWLTHCHYSCKGLSRWPSSHKLDFHTCRISW